jgi:hypothetical protein
MEKRLDEPPTLLEVQGYLKSRNQAMMNSIKRFETD